MNQVGEDEDGPAAIDRAKSVTVVLEAIDQLLDAIDRLEAPITCELLRTAMLALVQECRLEDPMRLRTH